MDYTLEEKYARIREDALAAIGCDPVHIAHEIVHRDYVNMHGPEHHFLDGAAFLAAYRNSGGEIDLDKALDELAKRTVKMPGEMCGQWGVCGSAASVGAAFVREKYGIPMEAVPIICDDSARNVQCIGERCPFYP